MTFTPLERDVLRWIIQHSDDEALIRQLMDAKPSRRKFTGRGSFTDLGVPADSPRVRQRVYDKGMPLVKSPQLKHGAGVVLFCKDGFAEFLEFFTFGAESFPQVLRSWQLEPWPGNSVAAARE